MEISEKQRIETIKLIQRNIFKYESHITYLKQAIKRLSPVQHLDAKQILAELDERRARLAIANKPQSERINYDAPGILIPFED